MLRRYFSILLLLLALPMASVARNTLSAAGPNAEKSLPLSPSFKIEIGPLLQAKCSRCHNEKAHKGDLNLTMPAGILRGGESGPVIVPGKPDESPLYEKVHSGAMPPGKKDRLSAAEVESIRRWIAGGAETESGEDGKTGPMDGTAVTQHDVIPIMLRHCTGCHGLRQKEGDLDLRTNQKDPPGPDAAAESTRGRER